MYKCRICGKEYINIADVINCETKCLHSEKKHYKEGSSIKDIVSQPDESKSESDNKVKKQQIEESIKTNELKIKQIKDNITILNKEKENLYQKISEVTKQIRDYMFEIGSLKQKNNSLKRTLNLLNKKNISDNTYYEFFVNGEKVNSNDFYKAIKDCVENIDDFYKFLKK